MIEVDPGLAVCFVKVALEHQAKPSSAICCSVCLDCIVVIDSAQVSNNFLASEVCHCIRASLICQTDLLSEYSGTTKYGESVRSTCGQQRTARRPLR